MSHSSIYFPLRSNAAALVAGSSVAGVRRRILAAALLHDRVVLEDGLYVAWAGPGGASSLISRPAPADVRWQSTVRRGHATGATHWVSLKPTSAPDSAPGHAMVLTRAEFSWRATFEPFRGELPASASTWLDFGHPESDAAIKRLVRHWESEERVAYARALLRGDRGGPTSTDFASDKIREAGYYDLAASALASTPISIDRRHRSALGARLALSGARRVEGHEALTLLLPTDFGWADAADVREMPAIREYRAIMRDIESAALDGASSEEDLKRRIHSEYAEALARARARGLPIKGRVTLAVVSFVVGASIDLAIPLVGGALSTGGALATETAIDRLRRPRWLTVDRRLRSRH